MEDLALARALHVLAVVLWIGGVAMVTTVLLPAIRRLPLSDDPVALFEQVESMAHEDFGSLLPAMLLFVPIGRLAGVARFNSGVAEETPMALEMREEAVGAAHSINPG